MKEKASSVFHVHDRFVRTVMSNLHVARDFFHAHLPVDIRSKIDLNQLILQPTSHIDDVGKESIVDLLYQTKIANEDGYLYLIVEHQTHPDVLMPLRLLKYTCDIMDKHVKKKKQKKLPMVYPMVIYHGKKPYGASRDIKDLIEAPRELIDRYFLKPFHLIDLSQIKDEQLREHEWASIMEVVLKHIWARDMLPFVQLIADRLQWMAQSGDKGYVLTVLEYVINAGELADRHAFFELVNNIAEEAGDKTMTLAEQLRSEGRLEGVREGIREGKLEGIREGKLEGVREGKLSVAQALLAEGVAINMVAKVTGLTIERLKALQAEESV